MMEKFFKPVHGPCGPDEIKPRRHHQHHHPQPHRYTMLDDTDRNTDESHEHHGHHQHGYFVRDCPHHNAPYRHQTRQFRHSEEDEILHNQAMPVTLSRASSSSLSSSTSSSSSSSSSPSSFSSWYTEATANNTFSLRHIDQPQHSLSCSNIADVHRGFREDDSSEPIVFASIKRGKNASIFNELHGSSQKRGKHGLSSLDRGHSRSDEGPLQGNENDCGGNRSRMGHTNRGSLYKTTSLNRSLAFSEEDILLGVSRCPKRAVSSSQLPSKGILKNKEPCTDIRKAKSMEVLSPRVSKGQDPSGQKGKGNTQAEIERARANFVQGKLQFSAFLDEITKQVISPSDLTILGVNNSKAAEKIPAPAQTPGPVKPQLPPKKHRRSSVEGPEHHPKQHSKQVNEVRSCSLKHSDNSNPDKLILYTAENHHGSPPPHHYSHSPRHKTHHRSNCKERRPSLTAGSVSGDRCVSSGLHFTDGTSTSPESGQPKQRHRQKQQPATSNSKHTQHFPRHYPQQRHPGPAPGSGLGSESSSTKSDSSRARDTASSHSLELSCQHHSQHGVDCKQCRDTLSDADQLRVLQEENDDLHQNLLQTVVCIESLETELQRTRDELSRVKEKYKSLLETHTGTKQANNLLGEHLHIASESLSSERKYLLNRVSELSSELEDAHRTMAALEYINVPCLIKELLAKQFNSAEAMEKFLRTPAPISHCATAQADSQSHAPKMEEAAHDWLTKAEVGSQRVTAFIPFKQGVPPVRNEEGASRHESSHSPPFTVEDISTAIYKKMTARYAARPQPLYPQSQQPLCTNCTDTPPNLQQAHVGGDSWGREGGVQATLLEQGVTDVTSMSAQRILDEFMQQLQHHQEAGEGKKQQGRQEGVVVVEHRDIEGE